MKLNILSNIFTKPGFIIPMVIVLILLIAGGVFLYFFYIKKKRFEKNALDLERKYKTTHVTLIQDVDQLLGRVQNIANQNDEYVITFETLKAQYEDILQNKDRTAYVAVNQLKLIINNKSKAKEVKSLTDSTRSVVVDFENSVDNLNDKLNDLLSKEDEFHQDAISLQRKYRGLKELYNKNATELKMMEESFSRVFTRIDKLFVECEELTASAHYQEASEKLPVIERVLNALETEFDSLPSYCVKISVVLPKKMDEINERYNDLSQREFPLHHLKINSSIEEYKATLAELTKKVLSFDTKGVGEALTFIDNKIFEIFKAFDDEENAKAYFDENCDSMYSATYELEKQFKKIKRSLPSYREVYLIKDKYLYKVEELENDINSIQSIKRDLDNYIHSTTKQPYTIIVSKIHDMESKMKQIEEIIIDFNHYLLSLKVDAERAYKTICEYYLKLKDAEYTLREMAVPAYSDRLRVSFERTYSYLSQIGDIIKVKPIDVSTANEILASAEELVEYLLKDIKEQSGQRKYAEESIVYANQYRQGFLDCKYALNNAGASFFEGDFTRTIDETVAILKKMKPDMNQ